MPSQQGRQSTGKLLGSPNFEPLLSPLVHVVGFLAGRPGAHRLLLLHRLLCLLPLLPSLRRLLQAWHEVGVRAAVGVVF